MREEFLAEVDAKSAQAKVSPCEEKKRIEK
jgi:hypothetical protein